MKKLGICLIYNPKVPSRSRDKEKWPRLLFQSTSYISFAVRSPPSLHLGRHDDDIDQAFVGRLRRGVEPGDMVSKGLKLHRGIVSVAPLNRSKLGVEAEVYLSKRILVRNVFFETFFWGKFPFPQRNRFSEVPFPRKNPFLREISFSVPSPNPNFHVERIFRPSTSERTLFYYFCENW